MSKMIQCDGCKKLMYADSRSEKGAYCDLWIDGNSHFHLCRNCHKVMMEDIMHMHWDEDEQQFVDEEVGNG